MEYHSRIPTSPSMDLTANQVVEKLGETLENFKTEAISILSLSETWKEIESSLTMADASMAAREKKLELRKEEIREIEKRAEELFSGLVVKRDELKLMEKQMNLKQKEINSRDKLLESWETDIDSKTELLEAREKVIDERFRVLELKEIELRKDIDEGFRVLESKEIESRKDIDERFRVLESKEVELRKRLEDVELKEMGIDERAQFFESKEVELRKREENVELKEKVIEERFRVLESREKKVDVKFSDLELREVEMKEKEIEAKKVQKLIKDQMSRRMKEMRAVCRVMEVTQAEIFDKLETLKMPVFEGFEMVDDLELDGVIS